LVSAYEWLIEQSKGGALSRDIAPRVRKGTYFGNDLVARPRRLALMNLYLHELEPEITRGDSIYDPWDKRQYNVVLTNPPFGTKGANQAPVRDDFNVETSNKQLNFIQHIMTILKPGGRAAVVVPDNCLFADQAGDVFKFLTEDCNLHTVLRLPNGTFSPYSPGTKTNVIFFTKGYPTENTWIYDGRANVAHITKKDRQLTPDYFKEFETCFGPDPSGCSIRNPNQSKDDRWRSFHISAVKGKDFKIDSLKWLKDEALDNNDESLEPEELVTEAISELESAINDLNTITIMLENGNNE
jgi:type I restriction enzyme M protein